MLGWLPPTYDYPAAVTLSDTADDPAGPFAGLYVAKAGNIVLAPLNGPQRGSTLTLTAIPAGTYIYFPVKRVNSGSTTADVIGLVCKAITGVK